MNKLDQKIIEIKKRERIGLMTHVVIGYPTLDETVQLVETMAEAGVDIVELQIPFSDPLADGPTIMKACETSLEQGTKVKDAFQVMDQLSHTLRIPLLFMAYYNTVFHYGVEKFCRDAKKAGASGLIVPDMAIDEEAQEHFYKTCRKYKLHTIQVISPASTQDRLEKNALIANGFVYCTARQGITGARDSLDPSLGLYLAQVRKMFTVPLAVGFGISTRSHIAVLTGHADIAVIGSAIIDIVNKTTKVNRYREVGKFIKHLRVE